MTGSFVLGQNTVQQLEFTSCSPEQIIAGVEWVHLVLNLVEDKGMVAKLAELHNHVAETASANLAALAIANGNLVVCNHLLVETCLQSGELALDDLLGLVGQVLLDILLETTQQE